MASMTPYDRHDAWIEYRRGADYINSSAVARLRIRSAFMAGKAEAWDEGARAIAALQQAGPGYEVRNPYREVR